MMRPTQTSRRRALIVVLLLVMSTVSGCWAGEVGEDSSPPPKAPRLTQMPSVFGLTESAAEDLLRGIGVNVEVIPQVDCFGSTAISTIPQVGTTLVGVDDVKLIVSRAPDEDTCPPPERTFASEAVWQLLHFAQSDGEAPEFAPAVDVWIGTNKFQLTGRAASSRSRWPDRSPLDYLTDRAAQVGLATNGDYLTATVAAAEEGLHANCRPFSGSAGLPDQVVAIDFPLNQKPLTCDPVLIEYDAEQRIQTVVHSDGVGNRPVSRVPQVVDLKLADAEELLSEVGFDVRTEPARACAQGKVESSTPQAGSWVLTEEPVVLQVVAKKSSRCAKGSKKRSG